MTGVGLPRPVEHVGAVMLFDGVCNFCSGSTQFIAARSQPSKLRFCAMQSEIGQAVLLAHRLPLEDYESFALIETRTVRLKSDAVLRLGQLMEMPWPLIAAVAGWVPKGLRDRLYNLVARNRYRVFGRRDRCMVPSPELAGRFLARVPDQLRLDERPQAQR